MCDFSSSGTQKSLN